MSKKKYYAVVKGRKPGIYTSWYGTDGGDTQVKGFSGALFKGFRSYREAQEWFAEMSFSEKTERKGNTEQKKMQQPSTDSYGRVEFDGYVVIYTDGGCVGNPGCGGYGVVILDEDHRTELSGGFRFTTNNRMELMACIEALKVLPEGSKAVLHSDSRYVVNGITKGWAVKWRANNWRRSGGERAENSDLWGELLSLVEKRNVKFTWVRGHSGDRENERCDQLAIEATSKPDLLPDHGYEKGTC